MDVGRALRVPGPAARAALRVRAGGCEWPGCDRPVAFTNAHHFVHWGHGGETAVPNLVLLCYRHHWLVHEGGWQLARVEEGRLLAIPPARGHRPWIRPPGNAAAGNRRQIHVWRFRYGPSDVAARLTADLTKRCRCPKPRGLTGYLIETHRMMC